MVAFQQYKLDTSLYRLFHCIFQLAGPPLLSTNWILYCTSLDLKSRVKLNRPFFLDIHQLIFGIFDTLVRKDEMT